MGENAQVRLQGLGRVEIVSIAATPTKGLPFGAFQAAEIDAALLQWIELLNGVIGSTTPTTLTFVR